METKLRTCAAPSGGVFQRWREGLGSAGGYGCKFDKLDFQVWALGLGYFGPKSEESGERGVCDSAA